MEKKKQKKKNQFSHFLNIFFIHFICAPFLHVSLNFQPVQFAHCKIEIKKKTTADEKKISIPANIFVMFGGKQNWIST